MQHLNITARGLTNADCTATTLHTSAPGSKAGKYSLENESVPLNLHTQIA